MTEKFTGSFAWNTIASGNEGPGPRSRHGLVYDRRGGATVLFGGIVWAKPTHLMSDTWELRNGVGPGLIQRRRRPPAIEEP